MSGPRKKPTQLRILEGNPGKRPLPENEPMPKPARPTCPMVLVGEARREWSRMVPQLETLGLLTAVDRTALTLYCSAYGTWYEARAQLNLLRKQSQLAQFITKTSNGNLIINPLQSVVNRAHEIMLKSLAEFGLSPASRTKVQASKEIVRDELEDLINSNRGN